MKVRKFREFASSLMNDASIVLQVWLNLTILVILYTLYPPILSFQEFVE